MNDNSRRQDGCGLIAAERATHRARGWSDAHDDDHTGEELRDAAIAYAMVCDDRADNPPACWPFEPEAFRYSASKPGNLVKAGALLAAEIDRYYREFRRACNEITTRAYGFSCFDDHDAYDLNGRPWVGIEPADFVAAHFGATADTGHLHLVGEEDGSSPREGGPYDR